MSFLSRIFGRRDADQQAPKLEAPVIISRTQPRKPVRGDHSDTEALNHPDPFPLDVVGESYHLAAFEACFGRRSTEGVDLVTIATLVREDTNPHDPQAVRVDIAGRTVGYLRHDDAVAYRQAIDRHLPAGATVSVNAHVCGGWYRGPDDNGSFGVSLAKPMLPAK